MNDGYICVCVCVYDIYYYLYPRIVVTFRVWNLFANIMEHRLYNLQLILLEFTKSSRFIDATNNPAFWPRF